MKKTTQNWDVIVLGADEFAEFEKRMLTPQQPSPSIIEAAQLLRTLPPQKQD